MINTHYHFTVQGYEEEKENGNLTKACTIELIAENEKEAIMKSATMIDKKNWRVSAIRECHTNMEFISANL